ncbi:NADAR family protein [Nocardia sp. NEAU-G5]|uniref:NADAR family protein n=1 Tax=Nocardia albiluteola TaxID=2842303 RepID=A0ABS6AVC8_9NOCA|nr:NADAR family protein [Nocardia albiluteola]MBU3061196.1 NADAR family protein [Nocardia albiluteola]
MIHTTSDLITAIEQGERFKYLHFWGHQPSRDGRIDQSCLSQWWPSRFTVDDLIFPTAEHYMMWQKTRLFGDFELATEILASEHPGHAKALGRRVGNFDASIWEERRSEIVVDGNAAKFGQNPDLKSFLLGTGDRVLVEASPLDRIWGIGLAADDPRSENPKQWLGTNLLGFALMNVRHILREDTA